MTHRLMPMQDLTPDKIKNGVNTFIVSNGSKWAGQLPDDLDALEDCLKTHTLENFSYCKKIHTTDYLHNSDFVEAISNNNYWAFFGNFVEISHVFQIYSNDPEVIKRLSEYIPRKYTQYEPPKRSNMDAFSSNYSALKGMM